MFHVHLGLFHTHLMTQILRTEREIPSVLMSNFCSFVTKADLLPAEPDPVFNLPGFEKCVYMLTCFLDGVEALT